MLSNIGNTLLFLNIFLGLSIIYNLFQNLNNNGNIISKKIYEKNNLAYTYNKFSKRKSIESLIPYLKHDKKNNDSKINFILLKNIGKTTEPNKNKISTIKLKKLTDKIIQC